MKKSKFIQSSKDVLSRSFNPSKCKTSLRLAGSRLKLLRNKKDVQVKQMKREIAQLLESGQDQTARIRVEHVIREEKMMAAYDLIEIYSELIVARLPIIESQKNCPIDLKEAIASIVFASPRCGDVPELLDIRKHFAAKYGKDFTTAAIELRPQCGVSRMLVEKLSATAPDLQTKIKILSAIAAEHNVKWDHKPLEEKDSVPPSDLLSGPSTFGSGSQLYADPSRFDSPDVQAPPSNKMHGSQSYSSQQDTNASPRSEKLAPAQSLSSNASFQRKERPSDRQSWTMEFKDATSAAQAAAESAERASMAARAAAELASGGRIMRQYSTESHKSEAYILKDEGPEVYLNTTKTSEHLSEEYLDGLHSEYFDEDVHDGKKVYSHSASLKSKASIDKDFLGESVPVVDRDSRRNSLKEDSRGESRMKQSFKQEAESSNGWPQKLDKVNEERISTQPSVKSSHSHSSVSDDVNIGWPEKPENIKERISKQPSVNSSRSHSSVSDDVNIFANSEHPECRYDVDNDPFVKGDVLGEDSASVHFDKFVSDGDDHGLDIGSTYDEQESEFHLPSPSQKSTVHPSFNRDSWGPGSSSSKTVEYTSSLFFTRKNSSTEFSENLTPVNDREQDNFKPVTFDDSDGPVSDSEEEINMSKRTDIKDSSNILNKHNRSGQVHNERGSSFKEQVYSGFDEELLSLSSDNESESLARHEGKSSYSESPKVSSLKKYSDDLVEPNDFDEESDTATGEGLNFGKLTGGLRHKGYNRPPYLKDRLDRSSSPKKQTTSRTIESTVRPAVESPKISKISDQKNRTRSQAPESDSDSDSSEEEVSVRKGAGLKLQQHHMGKEVKPKLSLGPSNSIFGSDDDSDFNDDTPKESISRKTHLRGGISRRTKVSPSSPGRSSYSKMSVRSEALDSDANDRKTKPTASYKYDIPKIIESQKEQETYEQVASAKPASKPARSNYWGPPEQPYSPKISVANQESKARVKSEAYDIDDIGERKPKNYSGKTEQGSSSTNNSSFYRTPQHVDSGKTSSVSEQESKVSSKSSTAQEPSSVSVSSESPKATTHNKTSSKDGDSKKVGHVHPKLPDYDFLVQSLGKNRSGS